MERPDEVHLSREDGEALRTRLAGDALTAADRRVLDQVLQWYFWLLFALQEARFSLKRLRGLLFGEKPSARQTSPPPGVSSQASSGPGGPGSAPACAGAEATQSSEAGRPPSAAKRRPGHGRWGADTYRGAAHVECRHETLAAGERCPVCGRGRLYRVAPGVDIRLDGHALLSAVRYVLEKLRCSACGQVFTAAAPPEVGADKYSARARAVLVLGRYYLGVPLYRLEGYQAMVGVPVSDATQWDQIERVADCAYPVFEQLKTLAAQGEVIYQDDTYVRILSLIAENRQAHADDTSEGRTGMYTTALVVQQSAQTICLYFAGRAHAGENLEALLSHREAERGKPLVMSDALASNTADEGALIRCHCLAHGRRKFTELEEVFPDECAVVTEALRQVFEHEEEARVQQMSAEARLAYHQHYSGPIMDRLKHWLDQQFAERTVEPNSSLGKAFQYLLTHWQTLTRFSMAA
jgi:transposase